MSDMLAIESALEALSWERPAFHSEADFQHALAWKLHQLHQGISLRLEKSERLDQATIRVDIIARIGAQTIYIELKYKTRKISFYPNNE